MKKENAVLKEKQPDSTGSVVHTAEDKI